MSNLTDALIAAKLVGGSGGSGGGGLPPIEQETEELYNDTAAFEEASGGSAYFAVLQDLSLVEGQSYIVDWDGTPYTCVAFSFLFGSDAGVLAGNGSIAAPSLPDTGEPFVIVCMLDQGMYICQCGTLDSGITHTIVVNTLVQSPANGALLTVKDGEWVGDMVIPPYSIADVGKVLKVVQSTIQIDVTISEAQTLNFSQGRADIEDALIPPDDLSVSPESVARFTLGGDDYELLFDDTDPITFNADGIALFDSSGHWQIYMPGSEGALEISDIVITTPVSDGPPKLSFEEGGGGEVRLYCDSDDYILNDISYDSDGNQIITSIPIDGFDEEENLPFATVQSGHSIYAALTEENVGESSLQRSGSSFTFATVIEKGPSGYKEALFTMPTDSAFLYIRSGGSSGEIAHGTLHIINNSSFNANLQYTSVGDIVGLGKALYYETITLYSRSSLTLWFPLKKTNVAYTEGYITLGFQSAVITRDRTVASQDGGITIIGRDNDKNSFIVWCRSNEGTEMTITIS